MVDQDVTYNVQYGTDTEFNPGTFIEIKGLTDTKLYNPVDFIKGELYYWRVYAVTTSNDTIWSDNGNYSQFGISELPSIISGVTDIPANELLSQKITLIILLMQRLKTFFAYSTRCYMSIRTRFTYKWSFNFRGNECK